MKHPGNISFAYDEHRLTECADFSPLDSLYAGRVACYGDYHCHSNSGGNSDGKTTPAEWLEAMDRLQLDFIGLMDHRQVRHMYLPEFDENRFISGSEPAGIWKEPALDFHYIMVVPEKECLIRVLEQFPDVFEFTGGPEGTFVYKAVEKDRFLQVTEAIRAEGGTVIHAHPKQVMNSDDPLDYHFFDGMVLETIYACEFPRLENNPHTEANYVLWCDLLEKGCKVYNTATSDCHGIPSNIAMNTVYSHNKTGRAYVDYLLRGDLNAGYVGMQMCIGNTPMGGTATFAEGQTLLLRLADIHPAHADPGETYRLEILTDRGVACSLPVTLPFSAALEVQPRKFYRAVLLRESDGAPAAIGNPIWLK